MAGGGTKTRSSVKGEQLPVAEAMLNIFKNYLGQQMPAYPGSAGVTPFSPQQVLKDYGNIIGKPMANLWQNTVGGQIGSAAKGYASDRFGTLMGRFEAQAQRAGEQAAYQEWGRVQPERGIAMQLGQAFMGQPQYTATTVPSSSLNAAYAAMPFLNIGGQMIGYRLGSGQWPWQQLTPAVPTSNWTPNQINAFNMG